MSASKNNVLTSTRDIVFCFSCNGSGQNQNPSEREAMFCTTCNGKGRLIKAIRTTITYESIIDH